MKLDRRTLLKIPALAAAAPALLETGLQAAEQEVQPVRFDGELHFGVMGDSGSGDQAQFDVAASMERWRKQNPWSLVLALGDNVYENGETEYFDSKWVDVYRPMLDDGVRIHSTLGNHDVRNADGREQVGEEAFGFLDNRDQYEISAGPTLDDGSQLARFICLNSNRWIEAAEAGGAEIGRLQDELREQLRRIDDYRWNIVFFHHPIHCEIKKIFGIPRGHGSSDALQETLEPMLVEHGVDLVLTGHDHFYQKIKPIGGVHHVVSGAAGKLRSGADKKDDKVVKSIEELHFLDVSLSAQKLTYQAIDTAGRRIDSREIRKPAAQGSKAA